MSQGGQANITIIDGGSATVNVPGSSVQLVIGTSSAGTVGQIIATRTAATLASYLGVGPLPEAAAMPCQAGGTVLAIKATTVTPGASSTVTTNQGTGGSSGTSVMTLTGVPVDTYYLKVLVVAGGTVGSAGASIQVSLDAGRNYGPSITLPATTPAVVALGTTGLSLSFAAGTLIAGNFFTAGTTEPLTNTAAILVALLAYQASPYAVIGVGSTHIVGALSGANSSVVETYLDNLAANFIYTRSFVTVRDASPAMMWGGTAETEQTWMGLILTDYSATSNRRICPGAAYWNMPSAFPLPTIAGAPCYRRPIAWAAAARQVTIAPQRHLGRVKDGALSQIVVNPTVDPNDGFVYHNEAVNPGLDYIINNGTGGRFMSTLVRTAGVFISNPLTSAPMGSDFYLLPYGLVMDVFASIVHQAAQLNIDDDIRVNNNGTIYENDARNIEAAIASAVNTGMFTTKMISSQVASGPTSQAGGGAVIVDRTVNVRQLNTVNFTAQIVGKAYVLTINGSLSFQNPGAAV